MVFSLVVTIFPSTLNAQAFVNDPSIRATDGDATIETSIKHEKVQGQEPKAGETFNYTGTVNILGKSTGLYNGEIIIRESGSAPFTPRLTKNSLQGFPPGVLSDPTYENGAYTFKITNLNLKKGQRINGTFRAPATLSADYDGNTPVAASVNASLTPTGELNLQQEDKGIEWDPSLCSGVGKMVLKVPEDSLGAWLMDIKFADISEGKDAELEALPADPAELKPAAGRRQTIQITDASGADVTDAALAPEQGVVIDPDDNTKPYYKTDPLLAQANAEFIDSVNWHYNPEAFTGKMWLEPGSTVTVRRGFKLSRCVPFAVSTSINNQRKIVGVQFDVARRKESPQASDVDVFGSYKPTGPWCEDIYFSDVDKTSKHKSPDLSSSSTGYDDMMVSSFKPSDPMRSKQAKAILTNERVFTGGIAIAKQYPNRIYYVKKYKNPDLLWSIHNSTEYLFDLMYFDMTTLTHNKVNMTGFPMPQVTETPMGFAPNGDLYILSYKTLYRFEMSNSGNSANVTTIAGSMPLHPKYSIHDLTFMENGDLVAISASKSEDLISAGVFDTKKLIRSGFSKYDKPKYFGNYLKPRYGKYANLKGPVRGFAFGPDGNLYTTISKSNDNNTDLIFKLEPNNAPPTRPVRLGASDEVNYYERARFGILDMASCSFGGGSGNGIQLRKYPVDPTNGKLGPAGGNAENPVTFSPTERENTVDYVIGLENLDSTPLLGDNSGTYGSNASLRKIGLIKDQFTAPNGFKIKGITVTGPDKQELFSQTYNDGSNSKEFTFAPGRVEGKSSKYFKVRVSLEWDRDYAIPSHLLECNTRGEGTPGTGLFNLTRFQETEVTDKDKFENNDACIPLRSPRARLTLVKQIVDHKGKDITRYFTQDLERFTLGATQVDGTPGSQTAVSGTPVMGNAQATAVQQDVNPGTYVLSETAAAEYQMYSKGYSCDVRPLVGTARREERAVDETSQQVSVGENEWVTCVISNTRAPKISIRKIAADPVSNDQNKPHIGKVVQLDQEGKGSLVYKIEVKNESDFDADAKEIRETFKVPAGLLHDGNISIKDLGRDGFPVGLKNSIAPNQLDDKGSIEFVTSINNMSPQGKRLFQVTIPVKADDTKNQQTGRTVWQENEAKLGACESETIGNQEVVNIKKTSLKGAVNQASVRGEYKPNNDPGELWYRDNFACIPVKRQTNTEILVHKVDNSGRLSLSGAEFKVCDSDPNNATAQCQTLPVLKLGNCEAYREGSPTRNACEAHYGATVNNGVVEDGSVFYAPDLTPGKDYWLMETKAPQCVTKGEKYCASLLPEPLRFKVDREGYITLYTTKGFEFGRNPTQDECDPSTTKTCTEDRPPRMIYKTFGAFKNVISVRDPREANLPISGGAGPLPIALASGLLILLSFGYAYKTSGVRVTVRRTTRKPR